MLINADTFSAFGRKPGGEMEWPRNLASVAPNRAFEGGKLEVMLSKAFEEGANCVDMRYRIGIEHNGIVEVCRHLF